MIEISIELLSPVCPASGLGRGAVVDRDVAFTGEGLPFIPARRLKGLLREALIDLSICPDLQLETADDFATVDELFGRPGAETPSYLRIGNAVLEQEGEAKNMSRPLAALLEQQKKPFSREDVLQSYTEVRRQTAIERRTGTPMENTLRGTRVLRAGLKFRAPVTGLCPWHRASMALAAAAIRSMGASRSRGLGEVRCRLMEDGADLSAQAMDAIGMRGADQSQVKSQAMTVTDYTVQLGPRKVPEFVQRFGIRFNEPAMFPNLEGDPNTVLTSRFLPGSAIRGAFARAWLWSSSDSCAFYEEFCSGNVLFLNAHPVSAGRRTLPMPHSVREEKADPSKHFDLARMDDMPGETLRRMHLCWYMLDDLYSGKLDNEPVEVRTEIQYHHQRSADRRRGRALKDEGTLFTYESILPGQTYEGAILADKETIAALRALVPDGRELNLGRSRAAQYGGGGIIEWLGAPEDLDGVREAAGWQKTTLAQESPKEILVTLLSPMVPVNAHGHPTPEFPVEELSEMLTGSKGALIKQIKAFARTRWQAGYLAHQRLPLQQFPALQEGSVFIFTSDVEISPTAMRNAETRSYGLRIDDGFGRVALRALNPDESWFGFPPPRKQSAPNIDESSGPAFALCVAILRRKVEERVRADAWQRASSLALEGLSNHLIARVRSMLEAQTVDAFRRSVRELRAPAAKQLKSRFVSRSGKQSESLFIFLSRGGPDGTDLFNTADVRFFPSAVVDAARNDTAFIATLPPTWLRSYLSAILWRKRKPLVREKENTL